MDKLIVGRALRTLLLSIAIVLASVGLPGAHEQAHGKHGSTGELSDASVVVRWSQLAHDNAFAIDPGMTDPFPSMRGWTMMYLAMHDALNAIVPMFQQYAFFGADKSAHPTVAAAQAARDVMNHIYPTREAENDAELAFWLSQIPESPRKTRGIALGTASAAAIIAVRASDNMLVPGEYALQNPLEPGDYRFVPPLEFVYRPAFGNAVPFAIGSGGDFLPAPPPALNTWAYALSVAETKAFGRRNSRFRTQDQTDFAAWWLEFNEVQWGRIMRQLTEPGLRDSIAGWPACAETNPKTQHLYLGLSRDQAATDRFTGSLVDSGGGPRILPSGRVDIQEEFLMVRMVGRNRSVVALIVGSALPFAQNAGPTARPQAGTELVVEWPDPVLQWNAVTLATATAAGKDPIAQQRILDIVHLAIFEAVNAITGDYEPYLGSIGAAPGVSAEAAAVAAAHSVLTESLPDQAALLDAARASSLTRVKDGPAKKAGIALGAAAARAMIDHRLNDGFETAEFHVPASTEPGQWQPTPGCPPEGGILLHLRNVKPFAIERSDQFRADPPPPLTSRRYAKDLNELKAIGGLESPNRPPDRADVARFYAAVLNVPTWNPVARQIAFAQKRSLSENARAFALLNIAMTDALISVFETKYHYAFWRPETAIAAADADDNPRTDPDSAFTPFITTPCHPSYPAGHGVTAGAARRVLERIYGVGPHAIEMANPVVPDVRLEYTSLQEIADDIDDARIYGGIHFRFDQQAGARQGRRVASYIIRHHLRPARQTTSGPAQGKGAK